MHEQSLGKTPWLLVVDHQLPNAERIADVLADRYELECVPSGQVALELLRESPLPDLILIDGMRPGVDGYALCRTLQADPRTRELPVLLVIGSHDVDNEVEALSAGDFDFIRQPVSPASLRARVDLLLRLGQRQRQRYAAIVESSDDAILSVDQAGCINTWNRGAERMFGYSVREMLGLDCRLFMTSEYREVEDRILGQVLQGLSVGEYEASRCRKDGQAIDVSITLSPIRYQTGKTAGASMIIRDISERRAVEAELERYRRLLEDEIRNDTLTGIPNRRALAERARQEWRRANRTRAPISLMMIDVDWFKAFNDHYGHAEGDVCLRRVAHAIQDTISRAGDFVARYGGEEFVVLVTGTLANDAALLAEKIRLAVLALDISHRGAANTGNRVSVSIGVADTPPGNESSENLRRRAEDPLGSWLEPLIKKADQALYYAKSNGRNQVCLYTEVKSELDRDSAFMTLDDSLDLELKHALGSGELVYFYQPKISLLTGRVSGVEALLRWIKPDGQIIPPNVFIPRAEKTGFIQDITLGMFDRLVEDIPVMLQHQAGMVISFNLTAQNFATRDLVEKIGRAIADLRVEPGQLQAELTETTLIHNSKPIRANVQALVELGVNLAMDDFGTGYSSIDVLSQWPFNTVKIHQGLIGRMRDEFKSIHIVRSCIHMAHQLGLKIVAEGIESAEVYEFLLKAGCSEAQGCWMGRPMSLTELIDFFQSDRRWGGSPIGLVHMAQVDHLQWRRGVIDFALARTFGIQDLTANNRPDHLEMNHRRCSLGQWYYGMGRVYRGLAAYEALEETHHQVHECGRQILTAVESDPEPAVIIGLLQRMTSLSGQLLGLLQELELTGLLQRSEEMAKDTPTIHPNTEGRP